MPSRSARVSLLPLVALAAACSEYSVTEFEATDLFTQNPWEKVDVLMVVDNSGSMGPYQDKLAEDFGGFFQFFEDGEVDWQIAVVTTDGTEPGLGVIRGPVVTPDAPDPEALFAEVVHAGTNGNGVEMGLEAAKQGLIDHNPAFPRPDSSISVIFVSDEQDASPDSVATYIDDYYSIRGFRARDALHVSALTVTSIADCTPEQFLASTPGTRYIEAAERTGGVVANLCLEDLSSIVIDLALTTSAMRDTFFLTHAPNLDTLEVLVEDEVLSCSDAWTYMRVEQDGIERPAIVFDPDHIPLVSERIVAQYRYGSGTPEGYCKDDVQ